MISRGVEISIARCVEEMVPASYPAFFFFFFFFLNHVSLFLTK